jgi:hypothetical protein
MTKINALPRTYATLRFAGDNLDPAHISALLPVKPKRAHRRGEAFSAGPHQRQLRGRTGIWYYDTRDLPSQHLADHLAVITGLLYPEPGNRDRLHQLRDVLGHDHAHARVSCFWYGKHGAEPPVLPAGARDIIGELPAEIDLAFDTD